MTLTRTSFFWHSLFNASSTTHPSIIIFATRLATTITIPPRTYSSYHPNPHQADTECIHIFTMLTHGDTLLFPHIHAHAHSILQVVNQLLLLRIYRYHLPDSQCPLFLSQLLDSPMHCTPSSNPHPLNNRHVSFPPTRTYICTYPFLCITFLSGISLGMLLAPSSLYARSELSHSLLFLLFLFELNWNC